MTQNRLQSFGEHYIREAQKGGLSKQDAKQLINELFTKIATLEKQPFSFALYHPKIEEEYTFGLSFFRPLVDKKRSHLFGKDQLDQIEAQLKEGHNVIFLSNHQTEPDPQLIDLLLEESHPCIGKEMIYVAGHRVVSDPVAIPFSMGRNLLCIFSKNYLETPPELKPDKVAHNQRTMKKLLLLLKEGGKSVYVAPSGGRDRRDVSGKVPVSPFNPQSVEMFSFIADKAGPKAHFYPLALDTYSLLPPPDQVQQSLGEERRVSYSPIHLLIGEELNFQKIPGWEMADKKKKRILRADYAKRAVEEGLETIRKKRKTA